MSPQIVREICRDSLNTCGNGNIDKALSRSLKEIKPILNRKECRAWVQTLLEREVRNIIHDLQYEVNRELRQGSSNKPNNGNRPAVTVGNSEDVAVAEQYATVRNYLREYTIAGKRLGAYLKEEIPSVKEGELNKANGHMFNVHLLDAVYKKLKKGQTVEKRFTNEQLDKLFHELGG